jgi:drug/metabolite transporter (DMT)-like permease
MLPPAHPTSDRFVIGVIALITASALSSLGWVFEAEAIARLAPLPVVCVSLLFGGVCLLALARVRGAPAPHSVQTLWSRGFLAYSCIRSALLTLLFAYCLTLTSSTKIMFLTKIEPYAVLLIQMLWLGHRTTMGHLVLLAIHVAGAIALSTGGALALTLDTVGDLLIFVAVFTNAALYVPSQRYSSTLGALYAGGFSQLFGGLMLLPIMLATSSNYFSAEPIYLTGWYYVALTTVTFYIVSTGLWFFSLREIPAWLASALRCIGPIVAAPVAWIVYDKPLSWLQTAGALVVIATSMWMVVLERRR